MAPTDIFYNRHLPHYQPLDGVYHIVIRLAGSLPYETIEGLRLEREAIQRQICELRDTRRRIDEWHAYQASYFEKFDKLIDGSSTGPQWLAQQDVATIVAEAIHHRDSRVFDLSAYTIMPNHVHVVASTVGFGVDSATTSHGGVDRYRSSNCNSYPLTNVLSSLKKYTARRANRILGRHGPFWQDESYDHVIRDGDELERTIWYVLHNPVCAGLAMEWQDWQFTYVKNGFLETR